MPLKINERMEIDVRFNGRPFALHPKSIRGISMIENIKTNLPTCEIKCKDQTGEPFNTVPLKDGDRIDITMSDTNTGKKQSGGFYLFTLAGEPVADSFYMEVHGLLDYPEYFRGIAEKSIKGTSGEVLAKIAQQCGMTAVCDSFQDSMVWIPLHDHNWQWAHKVADSGWAGEKGATSLGVDLNNRLHYRNLQQVSAQSPRAKAVYGGEDDGNGLKMLHWGLESYSGPLNNMGGYSATTHQLDVAGVLSNFENVDVSMLGGAGMNMGAAAKKAAGKIQYLPTSAENTHKNYAQAQHTNLRGRASYSLNVYGLFDVVTDLHIYDTVDLQIYENVNSPLQTLNTAYSGRYMVSARTCMCDGFKYREKIEFSTQGPQSGGTGGAA